MKKRIAIVGAVVVFSLLGLSAGWIVMTNMRGPGPDWNVQNALFRSPADGGIAAGQWDRFGQKGRTILWSSSFDGAGIPEIIPEVVGAGSTVTRVITISNTGVSSIQLHADIHSGDYASFYRYGPSGGAISKYGVLFAAWPAVPLSGNDLSHLNVFVTGNFWGLGRDIYFSGGVSIARLAAGWKKLYYWNQTNVKTDTGINIDNVFMSRNDSNAWQTWHNIKLVVNPTVYPPKFDYLEIDGHHFDLSNFTPFYQDSAGSYWRQSNYVSIFISGGTDEAVAKDIYIDDVIISGNE
jgi:hypothetical protein